MPAAVIAIGLAFASSSFAQSGQSPKSGKTAQQATPAKITTARALLDALEKADDGIQSLQADIQYDRRFELQGDRHVRQGRLLYRVFQPEPPRTRSRRVFEIRFDTLYLPEEGRKEDDKQVWVFDGRWLIEKHPAEKRFHAREIAPEGSEFDPLRIGEGPFPVPIGQKANDILRRFDAIMLDPDKIFKDNKRWLRFVAGTYRLQLIPKSGYEDSEEFRDVQLWYSKKTLLPRLARTINRQGDVSYVQLINVRRNEPMPDDAFDVATPDPNTGWEVQVDPLRKPIEHGEDR